MIEMQECINWIFKNKEWLFSGIGVTIISFLFGKKSAKGIIESHSQKIIKSNGLSNKTAEHYHEDYSVHITQHNKIFKRKSIDFSTGMVLHIGASGTTYTMPDDGALSITGFEGKVIINGVININLFPKGSLLDVEKNEKVQIFYDGHSSIQQEIKFFIKKDVDDD